jgi:orotidine-5'-phosphate decarboxylase
MVNLHAAGSRAMMSAALEGLTRADGSKPLLLAVTVLTSLSDETVSSELLIPHSARETVISYASNAAKAGLDGVVCSPLESDDVHAACGADFLTVTPGIRFSDGAVGDQSRVTTPAMARGSSDYIVVGRPITAADDPAAAYERCRKDFLGEQHDE